VIRFPVVSPRLRASLFGLALLAAGCSSVESLVSGDKVDYRSAGTKTTGLEVPPDLTQLSRDSRYQPQGGAIRASTIQSGASAPTGGPGSTLQVAVQQRGDVRVEREGTQRWLSTSMPPESLWPQLQSFWKDNGFVLVVDQPTTGVMETDWAENRAKIPMDLIRSTLGKVVDSLYSTSERDKFRTRVERTTNGTEIFITHRGMEEVFTNQLRDQTVWQPRAADPQLEAEFLSRLMMRLGVPQASATPDVIAAGTPPPARARVLEGQPGASLQVDDTFERAWRRVGLALDRGGFTVEDRDRAQGLYFVRYVDPVKSVRSEPGFVAKMFGAKESTPTPVRYRISVKGEGERSTVAVFDSQGTPENTDVGKRIISLLVEDLK
jgi:outer membrane protein assembly factor BamC